VEDATTLSWSSAAVSEWVSWILHYCRYEQLTYVSFHKVR